MRTICIIILAVLLSAWAWAATNVTVVAHNDGGSAVGTPRLPVAAVTCSAYTTGGSGIGVCTTDTTGGFCLINYNWVAKTVYVIRFKKTGYPTTDVYFKTDSIQTGVWGHEYLPTATYATFNVSGYVLNGVAGGTTGYPVEIYVNGPDTLTYGITFTGYVDATGAYSIAVPESVNVNVSACGIVRKHGINIFAATVLDTFICQ